MEVLWSGEACLRKCVCVLCVLQESYRVMTKDGHTLFKALVLVLDLLQLLLPMSPCRVSNFDICKCILFKSEITLINLSINKVFSCLLKYLYKVTVCLFEFFV